MAEDFADSDEDGWEPEEPESVPELIAAVGRALEEEHCDPCGGPCSGCPNTCDIHAAHGFGCFLWAANILVGATDEGIEQTEKALNAVRRAVSEKTFEELLQKDLETFKQLATTVKCPGCEYQVYLEEMESQTVCGNCSTPVEKEWVTNERIEEQNQAVKAAEEEKKLNRRERRRKKKPH